MKEEVYNSLSEAKLAKNRNRTKHATDEPISTVRLDNGKYKIKWAEKTDEQHSSNIQKPVKTKLTMKEYIQRLATNDNIEITDI